MLGSLWCGAETNKIKQSITQKMSGEKLICAEEHRAYLHFFCEDCKLYLCFQCKPKHLSHSVQEIGAEKKVCLANYESLLMRISTILEQQTGSVDHVAVEIADLITVSITRQYQKLMREIEKDMQTRILEVLGNKTVRGFVAHKTQQQRIYVDKLGKLREEVRGTIAKIKDPDAQLAQISEFLMDDSLITRLADEVANIQSVLNFMVSSRGTQIHGIKLVMDYRRAELAKMLAVEEPIVKALDGIIEEELAARKNKLIHLRLTNEFCLIDPYSQKVVNRPLKPDNVFPYSFDYIEVENRVFISGGETTPNDVLKTTYELDEQQGILLKKARMNVEKKWHTLCEFSHNSFYSIGGYNTFGALSTTEKYDMENNVWALKPSLREAKYYCGAAAINERYVYSFGGFSNETDTGQIERLDDQDAEVGWTVVTLANDSVWSARRNAGCYPISDREILVFGGADGSWRSEVFIFNTANRTLYYHNSLLRGEKFYRSKPKKIESVLYIIGYHFADLHGYNLVTRTWNMKAKELWMPKN